MIEIKNRFTGKIIHSGDFETIKEAVIDVIEQGVNLEGANLEGINLYGADLRCTNLRYADLRGSNLENANLRGADLRDADLWGANLRDADLRGVNLRGADLRGSNLENADLRGVNLRGADLWDANLRGADLRGVNLRGCSGNRREIKSLFISVVYPITYTAERLQIGCENHAINDWWTFDDERIEKMEGSKAVKFWSEHKEFIKMAIEKYPATPTKEQAE